LTKYLNNSPAILAVGELGELTMLNETLAALADPTRRKILDLLKKRGMAVNEIAVNFNITLPSLSHHLAALKKANLVSATRDGQQIVYSLNLSVFEAVAKELYTFFNKSKK